MSQKLTKKESFFESHFVHTFCVKLSNKIQSEKVEEKLFLDINRPKKEEKLLTKIVH